MIQRAIFYRALCDCCFEGPDYCDGVTHWADPDYAVDQMADVGWYGGGLLLCEECITEATRGMDELLYDYVWDRWDNAVWVVPILRTRLMASGVWQRARLRAAA